MRIRFRYKTYPLSQQLTNRSARVCTLTHPLYGLILGVIPGLLSAVLFPSSVTIPLIVIFAGIVAGPVLLAKYRKKKIAQFDAEYAELLRTMGNNNSR